MSGATTELSLATAVDSDDNADYLTLSLANSLRTVDGLFNAVTGHTHNGSHQGAPVPGASIPNGSITNAQLGPDVARANLLTNGGFEFWQRGLGPFSAGGNPFTADRWNLANSSPATATVTADTTNVDATGNSKYSAACVVTLSTGSCNLGQTIEDFTELRGKTITASMRVKTSVGGASCQLILVQNGNNTLGTSHTGDGTWQTLTVTMAVPTNTTSLGLVLVFWVSGTFYLDNAMLVAGSQSASYAPNHPADELLRCQRYYERLDKAASSGLVQAFAYGATTAVFLFHYKVSKAIAPTVTFAAPANYTLANAAAGTLACTSITNNGADQASFQGGAQCATGLVAGNASFLSSAGSGGNFIIEANP